VKPSRSVSDAPPILLSFFVRARSFDRSQWDKDSVDRTTFTGQNPTASLGNTTPPSGAYWSTETLGHNVGGGGHEVRRLSALKIMS
jgi:hypothetical protein